MRTIFVILCVCVCVTAFTFYQALSCALVALGL